MCHRTMKGILGSFPEALIYEYLVLVFLGGFYCCEIVVGRFEITEIKDDTLLFLEIMDLDLR